MRRVALFVLGGLLLATNSLACRDVYVEDNGPHTLHRTHVVHHRPHRTHYRHRYHHRHHHRYSRDRHHGRPHYGHVNARPHHSDATKFRARTDGESVELRVKVD
jgi:hypothetical protein